MIEAPAGSFAKVPISSKIIRFFNRRGIERILCLKNPVTKK
ncbi:MAG: hypothetical protein BWY82_02604 [Verrucomicrobia bacterium ADurb.Bin474]|nr:MAG: hypothetical protein BWY82_02604 [Verrucomicrobia bacterium ADurb.Bin474]